MVELVLALPSCVVVDQVLAGLTLASKQCAGGRDWARPLVLVKREVEMENFRDPEQY
jgi:hypothetical protein